MSLFDRIRTQAGSALGHVTHRNIDYGDPRTEPAFMKRLRKPLVAGAIALAGAALVARMRRH